MKRKIVVALHSVLLASALHAEEIRDRMENYVRPYVEANLFSGVIRVTKGDAIVYENAFGPADREFGVANSLQTKFQIASLSKPITAAAILLLVQDQKLTLEDKLAKFVPDFPGADKITIEELLTHYSGLGDASGQPEYSEWSHFPQTPAVLVERAKKVPPDGKPGASYNYSNSNYHILAFIIETVSRRSYGDFLAQRIFIPAEMHNTAHRAKPETIVEGLANGYAIAGVTSFERAPYLDWTSKTGNGSIYSTVDDLLRLHRTLQSGALLSPEMLKQAYGFERKDREVGMFWFHRERFGHRSVYVNGSGAGFKAHFERYIDDDASVVVLSNLYVATASIIAEDLGAMLFDQKVERDAPKPVHVNPEELRRFAGKFRFGRDYFVKNAEVQVTPQADHLVLFFPATKFTIPLLPIGEDRFFDRNFWSFVRFEGDNLIYRNNDKDYVAVRE